MTHRTLIDTGSPVRAPGLLGEFWFNSEPFVLSDLQGQVVLVHFWDYASPTSLRSLAYIKTWFDKYAEYGLTVVGVHTPEFTFGREHGNIQDAIRRTGIEYPVIADNDALVWTAYGNRSRPTTCLIDKDGFLRFTRSGAGGYDQIERMLQSLLTETGIHGALPDFTPPLYETDVPGVLCYRATPDIALGYLRGTLGNPEGFSPESTVDYGDGAFLLPGRLYLRGKWHSERECVQFAGAGGDEGTASVLYQAKEVSVVLAPEGHEACTLLLEQDGNALSGDILGDDVRQSADGTTSVLVERPGVFHLVRNASFGEHVLGLNVAGAPVRIFQLSFVTSPIPEALHSN